VSVGGTAYPERMKGGGILSRMRLLAAARGERPWHTTILTAMRLVTAGLVAVDGLAGTVAAFGILGPTPGWIGLAVILASLAAQVVMLAKGVERVGWHAAAVLALLAGLGLGLAGTWQAAAVAPVWWPMRYLLATAMFVVVAGRSWHRAVLVGLLLAFHLVLRPLTWAAAGIPWGETLARQLAAEAGLGVFSATVMYVIMETLLRAARFTDESQAAAVREGQRAAIAQARERSAREVERFVHDEVLHTLRTIAMDRRQVSAAAAVNAAARLEGFLQEVPDQVAEGATLAERLTDAARAVDLHVQVTADESVSVPPDVNDALVLATLEALRNVKRHAHTSEARVTLRRAGLTVIVEVADEGVGFDPTASHPRTGMRSSILQRMLDVGGEAEVRSRPGQGTTVLLSWRAGEEAASPRFARSAGYGALAGLYPRTSLIILPYFAYALWNAAWLAPALARPGAAWLSALLITLVTGTLVLVSLRRGPSRWMGLLLLATSWAATGLNGWALPDGVANPALFWAGTAALAVMVPLTLFHHPAVMVVTGLGSSALVLGFTVARAGWEAAASTFLWTIAHPAVGMASYFAVRLVLDALAWESYRTGEEFARARADALARAEFVLALTARMQRRRAAVADLVHGVASGELDAGDPAVRARADAVERTLRDQMLADLSQDLLQVAATVRERGHSVTVRVADGAPEEPQRLGARVLEMVPAAARRGSSADATVTVLPINGSWRVALTLVRPDRALAGRLSRYVDGSWVVSSDEEFLQFARTLPA